MISLSRSILALLLAAAPAFAQVAERFHFTAGIPDDEFGSSVSRAGDVDLDGVPDLVVGAPFDDTGFVDAGTVHVYSGATGLAIWTLHGDAAGRWLGHGVGFARDIDGDGYADIIAGMPNAGIGGTAAGAARIFSGADGSVLHTVVGTGNLGWFGWAVTGIGDVDQDGFGDFVVTAPRHVSVATQPGYVRAFSGATGVALWTVNGASGGDRFGFSCRGADDVDGDGTPDVVIGAPFDPVGGFESGRVVILNGLTGAVIRSIPGDAPLRHWGHGVGGAGDFNGDGYADVFAACNDRSGPPSEARVYSGLDGSVLLQFSGSDGFGHSAATAGDVNGDGVTDFVVGQPSDDQVAMNAGAARVYSGADGSVLAVFRGLGAGDRFGYFVDGAGDVNGDAFDDVILGTSFQDGTPGYAKVMSEMACAAFGVTGSPTQVLELSWLPGLPGSHHQGLIRASGAGALGTGAIAVSVAVPPVPYLLYSVEILIEIDPMASTIVPVPFDGGGVVAFPIDLKNPGLGGIALYLQAFELNAGPSGLLGSNGLAILFGP